MFRFLDFFEIASPCLYTEYDTVICTFRYVEQSHVLLEQRNDAFKSTASTSQAKVLSLEQEKVRNSLDVPHITGSCSTGPPYNILMIAKMRLVLFARETSYKKV